MRSRSSSSFRQGWRIEHQALGLLEEGRRPAVAFIVHAAPARTSAGPETYPRIHGAERAYRLGPPVCAAFRASAWRRAAAISAFEAR